MKINVRFFGSVAQKAGENNVRMEYPEHITLQKALKQVFKTYGLGAIGSFGDVDIGYMRIYVNGRRVPIDTMLKDGDEISLLSPIAGG